MSDRLAKLTSGRLLARNGMINLAGQAAPMLLALVTIPVLTQQLGAERFGALTLVWVTIGYFSVLDLGLGWALSQAVAERMGAGRDDEIPAVVWTVQSLIFALGVAGAVVAYLLAPWIGRDLLKLRADLAAEVVTSIRFLAVSLPFVATTASMRGLLEARQWFGVSNALRIPIALLNYGSPLLVLPFSQSLVPIVAALAAGRIAAWPAHLLFVRRAFPALRRGPVVRPSVLPPLLHFGGWSTVSNVVNPLLAQLDRFLLGALVSVAAVAYYVTPFDVIGKMVLAPIAICGVMFPAFAASYGRDPERTAELYGKGVRVVYAVLAPVALLLVALAYEGLDLWLGEEFAEEGWRAAQILAVGVFLNGLAQVPFTVLAGIRRPDLTARLQLAELLPYLGILVWLTTRYGIEGAAMAWTLRVAVDTLALFWLADRHVAGRLRRGRLATLVGGALLAFAATAGLQHTWARLAVSGGTVALFPLLAWWVLMEPVERARVRAFGTAWWSARRKRGSVVHPHPRT